MRERWAVLFLAVTGAGLFLWGLFTLPAPVARLIAGCLLAVGAVLLHLRGSPEPAPGLPVPEELEPPPAEPGEPPAEQALEEPPQEAKAVALAGGRRPMVKATATTYQEGGQTATHRLRVRIGGRRAT